MYSVSPRKDLKRRTKKQIIRWSPYRQNRIIAEMSGGKGRPPELHNPVMALKPWNSSNRDKCLVSLKLAHMLPQKKQMNFPEVIWFTLLGVFVALSNSRTFFPLGRNIPAWYFCKKYQPNKWIGVEKPRRKGWVSLGLKKENRFRDRCLLRLLLETPTIWTVLLLPGSGCSVTVRLSTECSSSIYKDRVIPNLESN